MYYQHQQLNGYQSPSSFLERNHQNLDAPTILPHTATSFANLHMDQLLNSKVQAERLLLGMTRLQDVLRDLEIRGKGVFAKVPLNQGTRFGPYPISELDAEKTAGAWDVSMQY